MAKLKYYNGQEWEQLAPNMEEYNTTKGMIGTLANLLTTAKNNLVVAINEIFGWVEDVETDLETHKADTTNPHSVTKSQVGLGNVQNYGIATQAEAEAGTANNKYMTPLRVQQAIAKAIEDIGVTAKEIYTLGTEHFAIANGYSSGTDGSRSKQSNHLFLQYGAGSIGEIAYVTDVPINVARFKTLGIDWENTGSEANSNRSYLCVSPVKNGNADNYILRLERRQNFSREIGTLDISSLAGDYYIRIHAKTTSDNYRSRILTYRIYLFND